jgi:hypothetical protein
LAVTVQIDTTLHRSEILVSHGFQRFAPSFNRTAVNGAYKPVVEFLRRYDAAIGLPDQIKLPRTR